ncbi:hypothetical protein C8R46DRAFT_1030597 [Mycena filopes]|nr:hypothetical protein C8R46DRAFT_1030597 [Mycena filopes]
MRTSLLPATSARAHLERGFRKITTVEHMLEELNVALGDLYVKREQTWTRLSVLEPVVLTTLQLPQFVTCSTNFNLDTYMSPEDPQLEDCNHTRLTASSFIPRVPKNPSSASTRGLHIRASNILDFLKRYSPSFTSTPTLHHHVSNGGNEYSFSIDMFPTSYLHPHTRFPTYLISPHRQSPPSSYVLQRDEWISKLSAFPDYAGDWPGPPQVTVERRNVLSLFRICVAPGWHLTFPLGNNPFFYKGPGTTTAMEPAHRPLSLVLSNSQPIHMVCAGSLEYRVNSPMGKEKKSKKARKRAEQKQHKAIGTPKTKPIGVDDSSSNDSDSTSEWSEDRRRREKRHRARVDIDESDELREAIRRSQLDYESDLSSEAEVRSTLWDNKNLNAARDELASERPIHKNTASGPPEGLSSSSSSESDDGHGPGKGPSKTPRKRPHESDRDVRGGINSLELLNRAIKPGYLKAGDSDSSTIYPLFRRDDTRLGIQLKIQKIFHARVPINDAGVCLEETTASTRPVSNTPHKNSGMQSSQQRSELPDSTKMPGLYAAQIRAQRERSTMQTKLYPGKERNGAWKRAWNPSAKGKDSRCLKTEGYLETLQEYWELAICSRSQIKDCSRHFLKDAGQTSKTKMLQDEACEFERVTIFLLRLGAPQASRERQHIWESSLGDSVTYWERKHVVGGSGETARRGTWCFKLRNYWLVVSRADDLGVL